MQLVFDFSQWLISPRQGVVGRQYDNLSHSLVVEGELPSGYTWDMLVEAKGKYNIIPLSATATGATASLTADQLAFGNTYYAFQLRGTSGEIIHHTNAVQVYVPDTIVGPGTWPVLPTEFSEAEANIKELNAHPPVPGENGYWMLWDLDTHSYVQSQLVVPGLHIEIGETTTGEPGTPANVTNSGTNTAPVLNFTIPEGKKGDAATIQVGTVTASDPGSEPQVKNSGTENAAVFDFVLPRGQTGPTGPAATIEVENTVTGEPGTQASVENVGTTGAAKLRFTIPRGNTGQNGVIPTLAAGNVETLEPGQPATASVTGEGPEYQINLGIPRGQTGAQGTPGQDGQTPTISVGSVTTLDPGQDATAEITGETPNLTLNLGIPEGQPGQDGVQLNDNAVNATEAWSSKKIVDTLCPPFSVSGNPVTCHPVEGYPLSAVVTLKPKQAGSGDPSPDNVRPISGYDSVTVNVRGKNLLSDENFQSSEKNGITFTKMGNGVVHIEGTATSIADSTIVYDVPQLPPGKYVGVFSPYLNVVVKKASTGQNHWYSAGTNVIIEPGDVIQYYYFSVPSGLTLDNDDYIFLTPGRMSYQASDFEPYQPGTTATLTLPETIYGGTVDAVTGVGSEEWSAPISLTGEETWGEPSTVTPGYKNYRITFFFPYVVDGIVSSHFLGQANTNYTDPPYGDRATSYPNSLQLIVQVSESVAPDLDSWKSYLAAQAAAGTPVQVAYKLATPEPFQATGNQALPAVAGLNTVYTDGDSLSVTGRQDLLYTLQTMQAQTQNLNRFIAEGGTQ